MTWHQVQEDGFLEVNHFARATPYLHEPLRLYAEYGVVLFGAALLAAWWLARRSETCRMAAALWAPLGVLVAVGLNQLIGRSVGEARPYDSLPHVLVLVGRTTDFSFPSDHAVMAGATAAGVVLVHRRLGLVVATAAVLMAFARVYVGAHYPLDVVAGLVIGAAVTLAAYAIVHLPAAAVVRSARRTSLRPLLTAHGTPTWPR